MKLLLYCLVVVGAVHLTPILLYCVAKLLMP